MSIQNFTKPQLRILAHGAVHGRSVKTLAQTIQVSEHRVTKVMGEEKYLTGRQLATYNNYLAEIAGLAQESEMRHSQEMQDLVADAYKSIKKAVRQSDDPRLAAEQAWLILKNTDAPVHSEKATVISAGDNNTQINVYNDQKAIEAVSIAFEGIAKATEHMTPLAHINDGSKHRFVAEAQVVVKEEEGVGAEENNGETE